MNFSASIICLDYTNTIYYTIQQLVIVKNVDFITRYNIPVLVLEHGSVCFFPIYLTQITLPINLKMRSEFSRSLLENKLEHY